MEKTEEKPNTQILKVSAGAQMKLFVTGINSNKRYIRFLEKDAREPEDVLNAQGNKEIGTFEHANCIYAMDIKISMAGILKDNHGNQYALILFQ